MVETAETKAIAGGEPDVDLLPGVEFAPGVGMELEVETDGDIESDTTQLVLVATITRRRNNNRVKFLFTHNPLQLIGHELPLILQV
jgi:organic radical activating enzyme